MKISKSFYGWFVQSDVAVGDRVLRLTTMKRSSGLLATTGSAGKKDGIAFSFTTGDDFFKTLASAKCRVTKNAAITQHNAVISNIDLVIKDIDKFYAQKEAELA